MNRLLCALPAAMAAASVALAAGTWVPRQPAIWNSASGYAFMVQCSLDGHAKIAPVERLGRLYQQTLTSTAYSQWRDVYQRTLHEKSMYSIAKAAWLPYQISKVDCKSVDKVAEFFILRLESGLPDQETQ